MLLYSKSSLSWLRAPSAAGIGPVSKKNRANIHTVSARKHFQHHGGRTVRFPSRKVVEHKSTQQVLRVEKIKIVRASTRLRAHASDTREIGDLSCRTHSPIPLEQTRRLTVVYKKQKQCVYHEPCLISWPEGCKNLRKMAAHT